VIISDAAPPQPL